jgi:hypothetical protein
MTLTPPTSPYLAEYPGGVDNSGFHPAICCSTTNDDVLRAWVAAAAMFSPQAWRVAVEGGILVIDMGCPCAYLNVETM